MSLARNLPIASLLALSLTACGSSQPTAAHTEPTSTAAAASSSVTLSLVDPAPSVSVLTTAVASASAPPPVNTPPVAEPPGPLPEGMKVLIVGDSFGQALGAGMRNVAGEYKLTADLQAKESTFIPQWAGGKFDIPSLIRVGKPDVVVISVGGNELAMVDPTVRVPDIEKIIKIMGETPCVWVRVPTWEAKGWKENDLPELIRTHSGPCRYYDSNKLSAGLPRGSDHIHPTAEGQKIWARQVFDWMKAERDPKSDKFKFKPRPADE
ncbi:MAG: SGNH/GDSL hydrolase family protein [Polyangiaceae bacterium]